MRRLMALAAFFVAFPVPAIGRAEDLAATEAAKRAPLLAALPADAAKRVFGSIAKPSAGTAAVDRQLRQGLHRRRRAAACRRAELAGHAAGAQPRLGQPGL